MGKKSKSFFDMQFITSCISTMLVLLLLGLVAFFVLTANNISVYIRENIAFSALVSDDMKETEILKFKKQLDLEQYVKETVYISKKQALKEQIAAMGTNPEDFVGYNPFSASIEIKLKSQYAHPDSIRWIEKKLLANKKIIELDYPRELLGSVNENLGKLSLVLLGLAILLTLISFALINNTIRLAIYAQRFLIHTMKLVGASRSFIRRPFILKNIWIGVVAAIMANAALIGIAYWLVDYEPDLLDVITPDVVLYVMGVVLVFGIFITTICSYISINKYLKMKVGELYSY